MVAGSLRELKRAVAAALDRAQFELALGHVLQTVEYACAIASERRLMCHGAPELDHICADIGKRLRQSGSPADASEVSEVAAAVPTDVYVASELYRDGGHTGLMGDYVRARPRRRAIILLTNIANRQQTIADDILDRLSVAQRDVHVCNAHSLVGKFRWLTGWMDPLEARNVFLFNHMQDCVATAVIAPGSETKWWFVHHANRLPCLGACDPSLTHVDVTAFCFGHCRAKQRWPRHLYVPLTAPDQGCRDFRHRPDGRPLTTASSGSPHKFALGYRPSYAETVARVLERTGGRHVHIGPLDAQFVRRLSDETRTRGVAKDKFVHVPYVPSVWQAMAHYEVDLYLSSFPLPGARASVEVMGSGTPLTWHRTADLSVFQATGMRYPQAAVWRQPAELVDLVSRIDQEWLASQSVFARAHFESMHHPDLVAKCLAGEGPVSVPSYTPEVDTEHSDIVELDALLPGKNLMRRVRHRLSGISPRIR